MVRVEEVDELSNYENDENVECPVDANFADEWNNSINSNPNVNHGGQHITYKITTENCV